MGVGNNIPISMESQNEVTRTSGIVKFPVKDIQYKIHGNHFNILLLHQTATKGRLEGNKKKKSLKEHDMPLLDP